MRTILLTVALILAGASTAAAQKDPGEVEKELDHTRSGVITIEQIQNELQFLITQYGDAVIHFVLPQGWEIVEQAIKPDDAAEKGTYGVYLLLSRAPVQDEGEASAMLFELLVFEKGLLQEFPEDLPEEDRNEFYQLQRFLNVQVSRRLKEGLSLKTRQYEPKYYGSGKNRPVQVFVPIFYEKENGSMLYTFTTFTGQTIWMISFAVSEDEIENYGALIAYVMDNSFGLTQEVFDQIQQQRAAEENQ